MTDSEPDETNARQSTLMANLENIRDVTAMWTGVKNQLVADGWSEYSAEQLVLELVHEQGHHH